VFDHVKKRHRRELWTLPYWYTLPSAIWSANKIQMLRQNCTRVL
jgi:hypothetical protein